MRELDLKALPNVQNPFPLYGWLRDHDPVHWSTRVRRSAATRSCFEAMRQGTAARSVIVFD